MPNNDPNFLMENVFLPPFMRNFSGEEGMYNRKGDRNFCVFLDDDLAEEMAKDGWNIKRLKPRTDDEETTEQAYLQVAVNYKGRPPRIVMITSRGRTNLGENEVEFLDWVDVASADMIIRPYHWNVSGKTGVKAYLQSLYVTIQEDPLELKYAEIEEIGALPSRPKVKALEAGDDPNIIDAEIVDE